MTIRRKIRRINEMIATNATLWMGTMWCVYAFTMLSLLPVIWPQSSNVVQYISSACLQLIALPLIMMGQNILNKSSERRAKADHEALMRIVKEMHEMHSDMHGEICGRVGDHANTNKGGKQ